MNDQKRILQTVERSYGNERYRVEVTLNERLLPLYIRRAVLNASKKAVGGPIEVRAYRL